MTNHASDCAVHNDPALPVGPCNCGAGILTADLIEKGCRAACLAQGVNPDETFERAGRETIPLWRFQEPGTRACLEAVLPDLVEACAKVVERRRTEIGPVGDGMGDIICDDLAASIRSLIPHSLNEGK